MMEGILSGCPLLESLSLIQCCGLRKLNCTSARLTKLMIVLGNDFARVEISGPNLISLSISGLHGQVDLRNVSSVVEATLDICHDYCNIGSLLESLHQASTFTITSWCILAKPAKKMGYANIILESYCQVFTQRLSKAVIYLSDFDSVLEDILAVCNSFNTIDWIHVKRSGNLVAHFPAKLVPFGVEQKWVNHCPSEISCYVTSDNLS